MPIYTVKELVNLGDSELVNKPEFKWSDFEKVEPEAPPPPRLKRGVPPAIQLAPAKPVVVATSDDDKTPDPDDELVAHYFLQRDSRPSAKAPNPNMPVKYAASLASSSASHNTEANVIYQSTNAVDSAEGDAEDSSAIADEEEADDGWNVVTREPKPRKKSTGRRTSSFSRWR